MPSDPFWYENPFIIFRKDRLIEFFPHNDMTLYEKLNAMLRFSIYFIILNVLFKKNINNIIVFPIIIGLLTLYLYKIDTPTNKSNFTITDNEENCEEPTDENPFMNVLISDYTENPNKKQACNVNNPNIKRKMKEKFEKNLYIDTIDLWDRNNSQREYYTMPNTTIPNDQVNFANWLYKLPTTCKELSAKCILQGDTRRERK
jgi:hypothetical protein